MLCAQKDWRQGKSPRLKLMESAMKMDSSSTMATRADSVLKTLHISCMMCSAVGQAGTQCWSPKIAGGHVNDILQVMSSYRGCQWLISHEGCKARLQVSMVNQP